MIALATVGYQGATVDSFLRSLGDAAVDLLVDVRAAASLRRPHLAPSLGDTHLRAEALAEGG